MKKGRTGGGSVILYAIVCALALASSVHGQIDIVSNLGQPSMDGATLNATGIGQAQSFQTGAGSLALASVLLRMEDFNGGANSVASVEVRADNAGVPGGLVEALGNVNVVTDFAATLYTVPAAGTNVLAPNTKYWVVVRYVAGDFDWSLTTSASWSGLGTLLDDDSFTSNGGASWAPDMPGERFVLAVRGVDASPVHYVALGNPTPAFPYNTWSTAATNIQDAIDATSSGETVLVSNGVYRTGGRSVPGSLLTNRVVIDKPITVASVNGPAVTAIKGAWDPATTNGNAAVRCVWMTNGASLVGFTLTNGATRSVTDLTDGSGGGLSAQGTGAMISNCVLAGNAAAFHGGGAVNGALNDCVLRGNLANFYGGAFFGGVLRNSLVAENSAPGGGGVSHASVYNSLLTGNVGSFGGGGYVVPMSSCTIVGNVADDGGGIWSGKMTNCIVYANMASNAPNYWSNVSLSYCCTWPLPAAGTGNFTNDPMLVDAATSNFTLMASSPCRDTGSNADAPTGSDLAGNPRIVHGYVDMGAFEFQGGTGQADFDGDGVGNGDEGVAGTDFTDAIDYPDIETVSGLSEAVIRFDTQSGRFYLLEYKDDLLDPAPWKVTALADANVPGTGGVLSITNAGSGVIRSFRVRISTSPMSFCGDGSVDPGEACDDGNLVDGDGCSSACVVE